MLLDIMDHRDVGLETTVDIFQFYYEKLHVRKYTDFRKFGNKIASENLTLPSVRQKTPRECEAYPTERHGYCRPRPSEAGQNS